MSWAFERNVFDFRHDPAEARRLLDAAGFPDPDGDGPRPRFRLSLKTSTSEVYRVQAAAIQQDLARVGIAVDVRSSELLTLLSDAARGNFQMIHAAVGGRDRSRTCCGVSTTRSRRRLPASNRVFYQNAEVDRLIEAAAAAVSDDERRALYSEAQRLIAQDVPHISLWDKENVAVAQAGLHGVHLSPVADFTFLKDVTRAMPPSGARE